MSSKKKISKAQIKRNRKAWVEALRSGKFKQTKGKLRARNKSFCCLGVACEVAGLPYVYRAGEYTYGDAEVLEVCKKDDGWLENEPEDYYSRFSDTDLPRAAREWLGVDGDGKSVRLAQPVEVKPEDASGPAWFEDSLIELNDSYGWSFAQIADAVEKYGLAE